MPPALPVAVTATLVRPAGSACDEHPGVENVNVVADAPLAPSSPTAAASTDTRPDQPDTPRVTPVLGRSPRIAASTTTLFGPTMTPRPPISQIEAHHTSEGWMLHQM